MISTPFIFLKSKQLSSQKETFVKDIQVFAENLIKKRKNSKKMHQKNNPNLILPRKKIKN